MKKILFFLLSSLLVFPMAVFSGPTVGNVINFEWDANTEKDLAGYMLYYGKVSRFDEKATAAALLAIETRRCLKYTMDAETYEKCISSWKDFCSVKDPNCDHDYFSYDSQIDVKNVTKYELKNLPDGHYFFALSAYDDNANESKFSDELALEVDQTAPDITIGFGGQFNIVSEWKVTVEKITE
jgi:hypothetical protein